MTTAKQFKFKKKRTKYWVGIVFQKAKWIKAIPYAVFHLFEIADFCVQRC